MVVLVGWCLRATALIDISFRLFDALISTVIVLAEREPDERIRNDNIVTLIRVSPKIRGEELDAESTGRALDEALQCIEGSFKSDGSIDADELARCREKYNIQFTQVRQGSIPRDRKWISLFFTNIEDVLDKLANHPLMIKLDEWFEPSRGNSVWSIWALSHGRRPDLGAKDFFYFSKEKLDRFEESNKGFSNAIKPYLVPAITRSQDIKTFTFTKADWESIEKSGKDAYIFICHEERNTLPQQVQEYIKWGETECRTRIRATRGGGRICSEAEACRARAANPEIFHGWYDLGGYIPTPLMAIRQAFYHQQFFYVEIPVVTYDAIITFIPKVRIETASLKIDPREYAESYPSLSETLKYKDIVLDETDLKALLAYLNSTFIWLWIEQKGRRTGGGIIALEVQHARDIPILNVKNIDRKVVEGLAKLFDDLEKKAREIITVMKVEEESEEEGEGSSDSKRRTTKLEMFSKLKPYLQEIDRKITEVLGITIDIDQLWSSAWEMMERRVKGAGEPTRPGTDASVEVGLGEERRRRGRGRKSSSGGSSSLGKWMKPKSGQ